jgi:hypothetical protein
MGKKQLPRQRNYQKRVHDMVDIEVEELREVLSSVSQICL